VNSFTERTAPELLKKILTKFYEVQDMCG